jgi:hypothetical protein
VSAIVGKVTRLAIGGQRGLGVADVCHAALIEAGRPELAELVQFFYDDDGRPYLEPIDDVSDADWAVMKRAEELALSAPEPQTEWVDLTDFVTAVSLNAPD